MGGQAEGLICADLGARTPINASGNFRMIGLRRWQWLKHLLTIDHIGKWLLWPWITVTLGELTLVTIVILMTIDCRYEWEKLLSGPWTVVTKGRANLYDHRLQSWKVELTFVTKDCGHKRENWLSWNKLWLWKGKLTLVTIDWGHKRENWHSWRYTVVTKGRIDSCDHKLWSWKVELTFMTID